PVERSASSQRSIRRSSRKSGSDRSGAFGAKLNGHTPGPRRRVALKGGDEVVAAPEDLLGERAEEQCILARPRGGEVGVADPGAEDELELGGDRPSKGDEDKAAPQGAIGGSDQRVAAAEDAALGVLLPAAWIGLADVGGKRNLLIALFGGEFGHVIEEGGFVFKIEARTSHLEAAD